MLRVILVTVFCLVLCVHADMSWKQMKNSEANPMPSFQETCFVSTGKNGIFVGISGFSVVTYEYIFANNTFINMQPSASPPVLMSTSCVGVGENIIMFGGLDMGASQCVNSLWSYNTTSNVWVLVDALNDGGLAGRTYSAITYDALSESIFVHGGVDLLGAAEYDDLWKFHVPTKTWSSLTPVNAAPVARYGHRIAVFNDTLYMFGGPITLDDFWSYTFSNDSWNSLPRDHPSPMTRMFSCSWQIESSFYIFSGDLFDPSLWCFEVKAGAWSRVSLASYIPVAIVHHNCPLFRTASGAHPVVAFGSLVVGSGTALRSSQMWTLESQTNVSLPALPSESLTLQSPSFSSLLVSYALTTCAAIFVSLAATSAWGKFRVWFWSRPSVIRPKAEDSVGLVSDMSSIAGKMKKPLNLQNLVNVLLVVMLIALTLLTVYHLYVLGHERDVSYAVLNDKVVLLSSMYESQQVVLQKLLDRLALVDQLPSLSTH